MILDRYLKKFPFLEKTWFQFIVFVLRRFKADRCQEQAGSLTYTTLFAVVPMLTVFLVIISSIKALEPARQQLQQLIYSNFLPKSTIAFDKALALAQSAHPEMDFSKLAVMGHSQGGGVAFPVMKHFLDAGNIGNDKNIVISVDGWFAFGMDQQDLRGLNTMASYVQFGGYSGTGTDARISLSISNLINDSNEKAYLILDDDTPHMYAKGDLNALVARKDLLKPILALLDYKLKGDTNAKEFVFKR